jgi:hypothetical protein
VKYVIHALILIAGFAGIRGYYWWQEPPAAASKAALALIDTLPGSKAEVPGWEIAKIEKDEEVLINKALNGGLRINSDGKVVDASGSGIGQVFKSADRYHIKPKFEDAMKVLRDRAEAQFLKKLDTGAKEVLVKTDLVGPPAPDSQK